MPCHRIRQTAGRSEFRVVVMQKAVEAYRLLLEELEARMAEGLGALTVPEKHRLYWDGMPVWGRLSMHSNLFAGLGANVLASTYCSSWIFTALDPAEPFRSMARAAIFMPSPYLPRA